MAAALSVSAACAASYTIADKTVDKLGVQTSVFYFGLKEGFGTGLVCQYGNIYMDLNNAYGKTSYANVLAAKLTGRKLARIDVTQLSPGGLCSLDLVEFND